jgi:hypothetical protein
MRLFALAGSFCILAAGVTVACSSAAPAAAAADAGVKSAPKSSSGDDDDSTSSTTTTTTTTTTTETDGGDAGTDTDGAAGGGGTLVTTGDGGLDCDDDSFREAEPNNDDTTANELPVKIGATKLCGVTRNDDPDFFKFNAPEGTQSYQLKVLGGNVTIAGTIDGQDFTLSQGGGSFPNGVHSGAVPWAFKITTNSTQHHSYNIEFDFQ